MLTPEEEKFLSNPINTISSCYRIINKKGQDVLFTPNWAQMILLKEMHNRNIILKARQLGSTTFWCIYLLNKALFQPNTKIGIISYSLQSAHDIFAKIIKHAIRTLPGKIAELPQCQLVQDSAREVVFANGSSIRVDTTMRGGTLSALLITEFGKICARYPAKAEEIITGSLNSVPIDALCVIESTAEGASGRYYEMWKDAWNNRHKGEYEPMEWKPHFFSWHDHPEYAIN